MTMRTGSAYITEYIYIIDFVSVVVVCRSVCNTAKAGKESLRKRVEQVAGYVLPNLPLARGRVEAEEVFHGSKIRGLHELLENPVSYSSFVGDGQSFPEGIPFHLFMVPAECHVDINRRKEAKTKALSQDITIQRCILILLNLIHMLVVVSKAVFVSICTPLVVTCFGTSA
jgi:hypothetical protein